MWPSKEKCTWFFVYSLLTGCLLLPVSCKQPEPTVPLSTEETALVQALNQVILPLKDADPARNFAELTPLDSVFSQVQLVGMGEATHGTHEFFQMKARLFRYLVEQHGFRTLAFEASFGSCVLVNRYIHGQSTSFRNATDAVKSMGYWTWSTTEVRDLIEWMRQYNTGKPADEQLSFYGFDCQTLNDNYPLINEFLTKVDVDTYNKLPELYHNPARIGEIYDLFVANEGKWVAAGGRMDYEIAKQAAQILVQQQGVTKYGGCKRDQYMAENTQWLINTLHVGKVSLWAHNYHIGNWPGACGSGSSVMGAYLKQQFKQQYLAVGTSSSNGSFNALSTSHSFDVFSEQSQKVTRSYNYLMGKTKYTNFALNLNQPLLGNLLLNWLTEEHLLFEPGAIYDASKADDYYYVPYSLKGRFDVLIHFRETTPSQFLP
ncbi:hypothetical protein GCM10028819_41160 [Spirosoma humi]